MTRRATQPIHGTQGAQTKKRKDGYYWVKLQKRKWIAALWFKDAFYLCGIPCAVSELDLAKSIIGPRIKEPKR